MANAVKKTTARTAAKKPAAKTTKPAAKKVLKKTAKKPATKPAAKKSAATTGGRKPAVKKIAPAAKLPRTKKAKVSAAPAVPGVKNGKRTYFGYYIYRTDGQCLASNFLLTDENVRNAEMDEQVEKIRAQLGDDVKNVRCETLQFNARATPTTTPTA